MLLDNVVLVYFCLQNLRYERYVGRVPLSTKM